jgi:hypothetical protein
LAWRRRGDDGRSGGGVAGKGRDGGSARLNPPCLHRG